MIPFDDVVSAALANATSKYSRSRLRFSLPCVVSTAPIHETGNVFLER